MALKIIPNDESILTEGEKRIVNKMKNLYVNASQDAYLYLTPRVQTLEPDFLLVDPLRGVVVIETKNWSFSYIQTLNPKEMVAIDNKKYPNPAFKTNQYYNLLKSLFSTDLTLLDDNLNLNFNFSARVIFTNLLSTEINEEKTLFSQYPTLAIFNDEIKNLTFHDLFSHQTSALSTQQFKVIRGIIFPEIQLNTSEDTSKKHDNTITKIIETLDIEQELFAKRIPIGHYLISGIPGSGKTVIVIARAIHLLKLNPSWKIAIITYNKSLTKKIKNRLTVLNESLYLTDTNLDKIEVLNFHQYALKIANIKVPSPTNNLFWENDLPQKALEKATPTYDAILVDEYQDFRNSWLKVCIQSLKTHLDRQGKKRVNLFLAGDRLQSIYNPNAINWSEDIGLDMRGRARIFKESYRAGKEHLTLALQYLMKDNSLQKEIEKFYEGSENIESKSNIQGSLFFIDGQFGDVVATINTLISKGGYNPSDILVLANSWKEAERFHAYLPKPLQKNAKVVKDIEENLMNIITYHSSKGLESKITILLNIDTIHERKLVYVGMTRASEQLYIHSTDFTRGIGKTLKELNANKYYNAFATLT